MSELNIRDNQIEKFNQLASHTAYKMGNKNPDKCQLCRRIIMVKGGECSVCKEE
jgi:hypothetical protein